MISPDCWFTTQHRRKSVRSKKTDMHRPPRPDLSSPSASCSTIEHSLRRRATLPDLMSAARDRTDPYYLATPESARSSKSFNESMRDLMPAAILQPSFPRRSLACSPSLIRLPSRVSAPHQVATSTQVAALPQVAIPLNVATFQAAAPSQAAAPFQAAAPIQAATLLQAAETLQPSPSSSSLSSVEGDDSAAKRTDSFSSVSSSSSASSVETAIQNVKSSNGTENVLATHTQSYPAVTSSLASSQYSNQFSHSNSNNQIISHSDLRLLETHFSSRFPAASFTKQSQVIHSLLIPICRKTAVQFDSLSETSKYCHVYLLCWRAILSVLRSRSRQSGSQEQPNNFDRAAFVAGISGLISRSEWSKLSFYITPSHASSDLPGVIKVYNNYRTAMYDTLIYVLDRLNQKIAPDYMNRFAAKVLAFASFALPDIASRLFDLLGAPEELLINLNLELEPAPQFEHRQYPAHLQNLFALKRIYNKNNGTPPSPLKVFVVDTEFTIDFTALWVSHWTSFSGELFFWFMRYYHAMLKDYCHTAGIPITIEHLPGHRTLLTHLCGIIDCVIHIKHEPASGKNGELQRTGSKPGKQKLASLVMKGHARDDIHAVAMTLPQGRLLYVQLMIRKLMQMIVWLQRLHSDDPPLCTRLMETIDGVIRAAVKMTSTMDESACHAVCHLMEAYLPILTPALVSRKLFWWDVMKRLLLCGHVSTQEHAFVVLTYLWPTFGNVPEAVQWLLDDESCMTFAASYSSRVRQGYLHLLNLLLHRSSEPEAQKIRSRLMYYEQQQQYQAKTSVRRREMARSHNKPLSRRLPVVIEHHNLAQST